MQVSGQGFGLYYSVVTAQADAHPTPGTCITVDFSSIIGKHLSPGAAWLFQTLSPEEADRTLLQHQNQHSSPAAALGAMPVAGAHYPPLACMS